MSHGSRLPRLRALAVIGKREYKLRIKSKGFWISTVLLPLVMAAWAVVPSLVASQSKASQRLAIADETGRLGPTLAERLAANADNVDAQVTFEVELVEVGPDPEALRERLNARILADEIDAWLWIDDELLAENRVAYGAESVSNFITRDRIEDEVTAVARRDRLRGAGYDPDEVAGLIRSIGLSTVKVTAEGAREEGGLGGFALALGVFMILYIATLIYGQQVMMGILDEKSSRILEVIVSSVKPFELLLGKLGGICLVGLTQLAIWALAALALTGPGLAGALAFSGDAPTLPQIPLSLVAHLLALFLLGFVLYSSLYAAIGSAFNNPQEAQQLASVPVIFVVLPWVFLLPVSNDPDSTLAVVTSLIPLLTPFLLTLRLAIKAPPVWQVALGYALTATAALLSLWISARIYRVGILMYGKKPTIFEIWRWARYR